MVKRKRELEDQMKFIENSIKKLSSPIVLVKKEEDILREKKKVTKFSTRCINSGFAT